jgi:hypothetical protein
MAGFFGRIEAMLRADAEAEIGRIAACAPCTQLVRSLCPFNPPCPRAAIEAKLQEQLDEMAALRARTTITLQVSASGQTPRPAEK